MRGTTLVGFGLALGLAGPIVATRALASLLFGVSMADPPAFASAITLILTVRLLASSIPAWRAARVNPADALRAP
jgi:ABC-type antimicrobial peptide transport system permease subunit